MGVCELADSLTFYDDLSASTLICEVRVLVLRQKKIELEAIVKMLITMMTIEDMTPASAKSPSLQIESSSKMKFSNAKIIIRTSTTGKIYPIYLKVLYYSGRENSR